MADILFLCTGNSCRSQMAEGWARSLGPEHQIYSAGIEAHGLNPRAVQVMAEQGIDITGQTSDIVDGFDLAGFDYVVTVCGDADKKCPVLPASVRRIHWPLEDPADLTGSDEQILNGFRDCRDGIRKRTIEFLNGLAGE